MVAQLRKIYVNQYKTKTKTKTNKGATDGGSGSNNNNNNNNTVKNTSTSTKNKKQNIALKKCDVLVVETHLFLVKQKNLLTYIMMIVEGLDLDNTGAIKSAQPVQISPMYGYRIDNPISIDAIKIKILEQRYWRSSSYRSNLQRFCYLKVLQMCKILVI